MDSVKSRSRSRSAKLRLIAQQKKFNLQMSQKLRAKSLKPDDKNHIILSCHQCFSCNFITQFFSNLYEKD